MDGTINLVAWSGTLDAVVSLAIAARLGVAYRRNPSGAQLHFFMFYLNLGLFFLCFATSQLVFGSGLLIGVASVIAYFFLYLGFAYLLGFPYQINNRPEIATRLMRLMVVYNAAFFVLRIIFFEASLLEVFPQYSYWHPIFPTWMRVLTGVVAAAATGFSATLLFKHGFSHRHDPFVFNRSLWLACGSLLLVFASLAGFIAAPTGSAPFVMMAMFLVLAGLVATGRGVLYQAPKPLEI